MKRSSRLIVAVFNITLGIHGSMAQKQPVISTSKAAAPSAATSFLGSAKAPVAVLVFSDFESFPCARSASVLARLLAETKDVRLIFKHAPAAVSPNSMLAHEAALAAGDQGKFWEMHDLLFENQTKLTHADLVAYAKQLNLNMTAFQQALDSHTYRPIIESDLAEARALGVTTTPTFFINGRRLIGPQGYASLNAVIESLLAGIPASQRVQQEIVAAGPAQQINLVHAPAKGSATAPTSLVEFSDFECPFCAETAPLIPQLLAAYPTQVRFAFKHYPLPMHKESPLAHEAALAAGEQGKFWEMHDLLFAGQDKLTRDDLIAKAKQLDLDMPRFTKDLDSHRFKPLVDADRQEGNRLGVDGTPFFFINGHAISGGVSLPEFKQLIDAALKEAAPPTAKPGPAR
ncbi:DSBA-like thioredoxin domain-containing protein (fragment) [Candidatus Sulfopaludibacter sp. SbA4]